MLQVTFLGTGAATNPERVQTGIALCTGQETLLLDTCGGATVLAQLQRAGIDIRTVHHIAVTHAHYDHSGGLPALLLAALEADSDLTVYAPGPVLPQLHRLLAITLPGIEDWLGSRLTWHAFTDGSSVSVAGGRLTAFPVSHTVTSCGYLFDLDGFRLLFSGDTQPCESLRRHAGAVDLLIHEAVSTADAAAWTHRIGHSTAEDAAAVAQAAGVGRLVLTHLPPERTQPLQPLLTEAQGVYDGPVQLAHDLQHVVLPGADV